MAKLAIGIDYGTLSARAILIDIHTGETLAESIYEYPCGVMDTALPTGEPLPPNWALQDPMDYLNGLIIAIRGVMTKSGADPRDVVGIGLDATAATLLPVTKDKVPLCTLPEFQHEPHAYMKLWKHHGGEEEAESITDTAAKRGESWLPYYGGKVSSEWTFPKILETLHHAPSVFNTADYFLEAMDWLVWQMTDTLSASACGMGYKALWFRGQFPSPDFLQALDPELEHYVSKRFTMPILPIGSIAGYLTDAMAEALHLLPGTPVGTPIIDAHSSVLGGGVSEPNEMMIIMGTSSCHLLLSRNEAPVQGIQGIVKDGIMPGYYGIEAGQSCVGDHFAWIANTCFPEAYAREAREKGMNPHQLMTEKLQGYRAGENGLLALDWFNGVRSPLMDFDLNGLILGMNLTTKPEDIYLALIEATAYGTRTIIENFETAGVPVSKIILGGGIPAKNPFIVQLYADILKRPIRISASTQACALGAAMLGICAAPKDITGYDSLESIVRHLARVQPQVYQPNADQSHVYDDLYSEYMQLHNYFGKGGNDVMHRLNRMRRH